MQNIYNSILQNSVDPSVLINVLRSPDWTVYATKESKLYFVNNATKGIL